MMAVILRRAVTSAANGHFRPIQAGWLASLSSSNGPALAIPVGTTRKQNKSTNRNNTNKSSSDPFEPQLNYRIYKPDNLTTNDTKKSHEKPLLEDQLDLLSKEKSNPDRHDLQSKLETLEAFGCTLDQIQESPEILQLTLTEIVQRASALKKLRHEDISVQLLRIIRSDMSVAQLRSKIRSLEHMSNFSTLSKYMQEVLQCTHGEMHMIAQKVPSIKAFRNMTAFSEKVEYLRSAGITTEDMITYPGILCRSITLLKYRIGIIKELQEDDNFPVASLIIGDKQFQKFLVKYDNDQQMMKGSQNRSECIAKMFDVPEMIESQLHYFYNRRLTTVKPRIEYLMSVGIPLEDIRNHPYILRYKTENLEKAFIKSQEAGIVTISVLHLIHIIICGRVPLRPPRPKSSNYIPELLGLSVDEIKKNYTHLRPLASKNRLSLKQNLDFLVGEGFTVEDVCTCPLILSNTLEDLKKTFKTLALRPEMQNNSDLLQNGTMKLNLMQYFLEKESNFRLSSAEIL